MKIIGQKKDIKHNLRLLLQSVGIRQNDLVLQEHLGTTNYAKTCGTITKLKKAIGLLIFRSPLGSG